MNEDGCFVIAAIVFCLVLGFVTGWEVGTSTKRSEIYSAICAADSASLASDTLCVRPDSSWRVRP